MLRAAFFFGERLYKLIIHFLRLFIYVGKVFVQLAFSEQVGIENRAAVFDIVKVLLSLKPIGRLSCSGNVKFGSK